MLISLLLCSCGIQESSTENLPKVPVSFENQSQFTVEALFLHQDPQGYATAQSLISSPLEPTESINDSIPNTLWYVTVYRKPNQDSSVLAYTTARAWNPETHPTVIYFDEQFRVSAN